MASLFQFSLEMLFSYDMHKKIQGYKNDLVRKEVNDKLNALRDEAKRVIALLGGLVDSPINKKIYKKIALDFFRNGFDLWEMEYMVTFDYALNILMEC